MYKRNANAILTGVRLQLLKCRLFWWQVVSVNQITRRETSVHTVVKEYLSKFYPNHSLPGPNQCETITD